MLFASISHVSEGLTSSSGVSVNGGVQDQGLGAVLS